MIRLARPEVREATQQEAAAIKASFERHAADARDGLLARLRRMSKRQIGAGLLAIAIVPGTVALAHQLDGNDRSDQLEQAQELVQPNPEQVKGLTEGCRDLLAAGLESDPCTALLREIDKGPQAGGGEGGGYTPSP